MITWMQKHKRWLIVTVWVSTIAFVGAGFVGWGSYDLTQKKSTITTINDKKISINDFQYEYRQIFNQYNQILGGKLDNELAKQYNLQSIAYERLINKYMLLVFADELGIQITNNEAGKSIVNIEAFLDEKGAFNKEKYISSLNKNGTTIKEFERRLKENLSVAKIYEVYSTGVSDVEIKNINKILDVSYKVSIATISHDDIKVKASSDVLKKYYEKNKANYLSKSYTEVYFNNITINKDDEAKSNTEALKYFLSVKKDKIKMTNIKKIYSDDVSFTKEQLELIKTSEVNKALKPMKIGDSFMIIKIKAKKENTQLSFKQAKKQVKLDYINATKIAKLQSKRNALIEKFSGKSIGYIDDNSKIKGLTSDEVRSLNESIINSKSAISFATLDKKTIVFNITDIKSNKTNKEQTQNNKEYVSSIKNNSLMQNIIEDLKSKYKTVEYTSKESN